MDKIQEIIKSFSKEDSEEFKNFINRLKKKSSRKDLELYDLLETGHEYKREELIQALYPEDNNMEAYHATRKRLVKQLADYIHYKKINETENNESKVLGLYYLSQHLYEQGKYQIACTYIKKAEQIAEKQKLYSILHKIYLLQMVYSHTAFSVPFPTIIRKKKLNLEKLYKTDNIITAQKVIKNRLTEVLADKEDFHIELLIKNVIADHELGNVVDEDFDFLFSIIKTVEEVVKENNAYEAFERYIVSTYNEFKETIGKQDLSKHLEFLYMISHTLFMNKKYALAEKYLNELTEFSLISSTTKKQYYSALMTGLRAKIAIYSNKAEDAIASLTKFLKEEKALKVSELNTRLLLAYAYFLKNKADHIDIVFDNEKHSDAWCTKIAGEEWIVKKKTLLAIKSLEKGELSSFDTQIRIIQKENTDFLKTDEGVFWKKLFKAFNKLEYLIATNKENELMGEVIKMKTMTNEMFDNIEAMIIFNWFEAKCSKKEFYSSSLSLHATAD